jgi:CRP-like cAMP-binding protein
VTYDGGVQWELLEGVPAHDLQHVLAIARRRVFGRGEVVFHQDDPADSLHLVV